MEERREISWRFVGMLDEEKRLVTRFVDGLFFDSLSKLFFDVVTYNVLLMVQFFFLHYFSVYHHFFSL